MTIDQLTDEYQKWCQDNQLPLLSADELLAELQEQQYSAKSETWLATIRGRMDYLGHFIARWDAADEEEVYSDL